jgi:ribosomal protein S18 acetylase RimI-like enzyme/ubiquinone/menaquinone biosynthesis C-methylase UbiE
VTLRVATAADVEAVARIHVASWGVAYRGIMPDDVIARTDLAYRTRFWTERIAVREWPVFVIEEDRELVAFCQMVPSPDSDDDPRTVGHITSIHALPHLRGRGHGRALLDHAFAEFRRRGYGEVTLWVLEGNASARRFYEGLGFHEDGGRKMYPGTKVAEVRYRLTVSHFADHFSAVSAGYAAFRPRYPDPLFDLLADAAPARDAAWDCATGNGQAAIGLARHFARVIATDASEEQIAHATQHPRVTYGVARAEASGLDGRSVDLVTAAQAVHWFDRPRFWAEARRVLRPGGVVAVWTYWFFSIAPELDAIVQRFYKNTVGPFWPPERKLTEDRYRSIEFPFEEFPVPEFTIEQRLTLDDVAGYIRTWSATRGFIKARGHDPVDALIAELAPLWGDPRTPRLARWPVAVRAGRI